MSYRDLRLRESEALRAEMFSRVQFIVNSEKEILESQEELSSEEVRMLIIEKMLASEFAETVHPNDRLAYSKWLKHRMGMWAQPVAS